MEGAISQADLMSLQRTIAETIKASQKSMTGAMLQASSFAAQSAAKVTPQAKKNRKSKRIKAGRTKENKTRIKNGVPWWAIGSVEIWKGGVMKNTFFLGENGFQRARATPRRGLGKRVWRVTAAKGAAMFDNAGGFANRFATTRKQMTDGMLTSIEMTNALEYISKVAPQSAAIGVRMADNRMQGILNRKLARDIERAFQRRSINGNQ